MDVEILRTRGLGNATYILASDGDALIVDPPRDAWRARAILERRGWRLRTVVETHVHNDYLSGALELAAADRASVVAPGRGRFAFDHRPVDDGDEVEVAGVRLRARATPGHTPEHLAWEVYDHEADASGTPTAVLTGGSLLVGSVGRTDLLGDEAADRLSLQQFQSLRALAEMPDSVAVWPTHGSGSFCAAGPVQRTPTSTIGDERRSNPLFGIADAAVFRDQLIAGFAPYPAYYGEMGSMNRSGPVLLGERPTLTALDPDGVSAAIAGGARVVDARSRDAVAAGHIPGSLTIELGDTFASYVGWILPVGTPLVLVLPGAAAAAEEAVDQLVRIGFDRLVGMLDGGFDRWPASGRPVAEMGTISAATLADELRSSRPPVVLDVRDPQEWREEGRIEDAVELPLPHLIAGDDPGLPDGVAVTVACRSGSRASIAAGLILARGHPVRIVERGGIPDVAARLATRETTEG